METCIRCDVGSEEVRLFDAIYEGRMAVICERCSIIENIPIIKKPDSEKLKESESSVGVYDRMRTMAGMREPERNETYFQEDRLNELNRNPEIELPEKEQLKLINNFQWEIMNNRRRRGLTHQQLGEALGESEMAIQMIEKGKLPENAERLVKKLEQFFQTRLKEISERERMIKAREESEEPILLDDEGNVLDEIPEERPYIPTTNEEIEEKPEVECKIEQFDDEKRKMTCETIPGTRVLRPYIDETKDLDLRRVNAQNVTINDLKEIHKKKVEVSRQEQIEEQKKIEERQRILEALRERGKLKQEQERGEKLVEMQRIEQKKQRLINERKREFEERRKKESQDVDRFLGGSELLNREGSKRVEERGDVDEFDNELR